MCMPHWTWQYYEAKQQARHVHIVTHHPITQTMAQSSIPPTSPFADGEQVFMIIHDQVPGIHYGWYNYIFISVRYYVLTSSIRDECIKYLITFDDSVKAFHTISEAASYFAQAQLNGEVEWLDSDIKMLIDE